MQKICTNNIINSFIGILFGGIGGAVLTVYFQQESQKTTLHLQDKTQKTKNYYYLLRKHSEKKTGNAISMLVTYWNEVLEEKDNDIYRFPPKLNEDSIITKSYLKLKSEKSSKPELTKTWDDINDKKRLLHHFVALWYEMRLNLLVEMPESFSTRIVPVSHRIICPMLKSIDKGNGKYEYQNSYDEKLCEFISEKWNKIQENNPKDFPNYHLQKKEEK